MGKYTVLDDPWADAAVQKVLDKVSEGVLEILGKKLQAIVLVGGYGRGEGGIYRVADDYSLVNDLDLLVFVRGSLKKAKKSFSNSLKELSHRLLEYGKGLKDIDMELTHINRYKYFVPKTVGYYEIANGHQVIYGDIHLKNVMPDIDPTELSLFEGTNYFRNRGSGLLIAALYFLTDGLKDPDKRKNFQIELHKACQAMGDAFLLMNGQYHFSYRERLERFKKLKDSGRTVILEELLKRVSPLYEWGISNKLAPSFDWPGDKEMIDKWFEIQETFGHFFLWYESTRLKKRFAEWNDYAQYVEYHGAAEPFYLRLRSILWSMPRFIKSLKNREIGTMSPIQRTMSCLKIMPLLLFSLTPGLKIQLPFVKKVTVIMEHPTADTELALWKKLLHKFLMTYYPTGVVKDAVVSLG